MAKPLSAQFAAVGVFDVVIFVIPQMDFEIGGCLELLFADGTLQLLQIGVDQHVTVDQVALSVMLATKFAPGMKVKLYYAETQLGTCS